jgi:hypothetical protein
LFGDAVEHNVFRVGLLSVSVILPVSPFLTLFWMLVTAGPSLEFDSENNAPFVCSEMTALTFHSADELLTIGIS